MRKAPSVATLAILLGGMGMAALACKPQVQIDQKNSSTVQEARVTPAQAQQAAQVVEQTRSYLPYEYTPDGCYARASYMQMELQRAGIPSEVAYVRAPAQLYGNPTAGYQPDYTPDGARLQPEQWVYHVAPVITVNGQRTVLDPSLAPTATGGAVPYDQWMQTMNARNYQQLPEGFQQNGGVALSKSPNQFIASIAPNTENGPFSPTSGGRVITDASQMQPITREGLLANYQTMDGYLTTAAAEGRISVDQMEQRREDLYNRTLELSQHLNTNNQITNPGGTTTVDSTLLDPIRSKNTTNYNNPPKTSATTPPGSPAGPEGSPSSESSDMTSSLTPNPLTGEALVENSNVMRSNVEANLGGNFNADKVAQAPETLVADGDFPQKDDKSYSLKGGDQ